MSQGLEQLTDEVLNRWVDAARLPPGHESAPPPLERKQLLEFLDIAFLASLTYDERRPTTFQLILSQEDERKKDHHFRPGGEFTPIVLENPLPFEPAQVRRLAPATDPSRVLIGVEIASGDPSKFYIWGLLDLGSEWTGYLRHERSGATVPPDLLSVTSAEPGHLQASRGGSVIAVLRGGSVSIPRPNVLHEGPVAAFFEDAKSACHQQVCEHLKAGRYSDGDEDGGDDDWPQRSYVAIIERLLLNITFQGHGGAVLFIPEKWRSDRRAWSPAVSIKYSIDDIRLWDQLVRNVELHKRYYDLYFRLTESKSVTREEYGSIRRYQGMRDEIEERISDTIAFTGSLAGVDGAIIMTDRLRVLGFGVEVTAPTPVLHAIRVAGDTSSADSRIVPVDSFGTRHRAAFRYCWSLPQAVSFVTSQDGGIRAVRRVGDDVVTWTVAFRSFL